MASLWKHPKSKYFVACYTDFNGRRLKTSTRSTNRKEAQKIADGYEEAARKRQTAKKVREVIQNLHAAITGEAIASSTVRSYFETWLASKRHSTAPATVAFYETVTKLFLAYSGERADNDITEVSKAHVQGFINEHREKKATSTANHYLKCLRMIFKSAERDGYIDSSPCESIQRGKSTKTVKRKAFSSAQITTILAKADEEWKSMVLFGIYTGQRLADIAAVLWDDLHLEKAQWKLVTRKTGKVISVPIAAPLLTHLKGLVHTDHDTVHPRASEAVRTQAGRSGSLSNQFARLLRKSGIRTNPTAEQDSPNSEKRRVSALSFHSLRHTAVTLLKEAGIPQAVVMELIGHDSEQMSQYYTHVGQEALRKATEAFPDFST